MIQSLNPLYFHSPPQLSMEAEGRGGGGGGGDDDDDHSQYWLTNNTSPPPPPLLLSSPSSSLLTKRHQHPQETQTQRPTKRKAPPPSSAAATVSQEEASALSLLRLLLRCAEAVSTENFSEAALLLPQISSLSSPFGSSPERVAAYFASALQSRIISTSLDVPMTIPPPTLPVQTLHRILRAFQSFNSISPLIKFSHFTSNQAILQAFESKERIHIIDLDIMQGLQWPGLFHILASRRPRRLQSLRITGIGPSKTALDSTGKRLSEFAASLGLNFEFNGIDGKTGNLTDIGRYKLRNGEALAVHWMQHNLYNAAVSDTETAAMLVRMSPDLVTIVEQDLSYDNGNFLGRFVDALHYYSALFDAIDEGDEEERHVVEQQVLGWEIRNVVVGGRRRDWVGKWGEEMRKLGFREVSLGGGSPAAAQASLLLGMFPWRQQGYTLVEEGGCLKLGWKDLPLLTASAWQRNHHHHHRAENFDPLLNCVLSPLI